MLEPDLQIRFDKLQHQFPSKTVAFDGHTVLERPSPEQTRGSHIRNLYAFQDSLQLVAPRGFEAYGNFAVAYKVIFQALDAVVSRGYNTQQSYQIVARSISIIGRLTE